MQVDIRGKALAVERQGQGEAVVFLHGLGSTLNVFEPQARALADRFTRRALRPRRRRPLAARGHAVHRRLGR